MLKQIHDILIEKIQLRKRQKDIFEKVQVGDMLWCKMPLSKKELSEIETSHRVRPYLIVKKEKNFLLCYQSTSKNRENLNNYERYCIKAGKYKNKKDSWIDLTNIEKIRIKDIQLEFIKLNQIDIKKIEKRITIGQNKGNSQLIRFNEPIYIEEGDLILRNQISYYVYAEDNVNIYCFKIQKRKRENQKLEKIIINGKSYYTDFRELRTIKRNENVVINNIAYTEELLAILNQKKSLKASAYNKFQENRKREQGEFEIGTVFQYGNSKVMYLYSRDNRYYGVDLLWYTIKPRIFEIKEIQKRKIIGTKHLKELNKILEFLLERNSQTKEINQIYKYVRSLLFSSTI